MPKPNLDDYITVAERIAAFYKEHERGSIRTEIVHDDGKRVVIRAEVFRHSEDSAPATGHAEEIRGDGPVNKTSALENAETSAVGRAIAMLGFHVKKGVASREEVEQAIAEEARQAKAPANGEDKRAMQLRERIVQAGLVDHARTVLTSLGVDRLEDLDNAQAAQVEAWLTKQVASG